MTERGSQFAKIQEALQQQKGVKVLGYQEDAPVYNGRKGTVRRPVHIFVSPNEGYQSVEQINQFSANLLPDTDRVFRQDGQVKVNEKGEIVSYGKLRSFDRLGEREMQTIEIEIQPNTESNGRL